LAGEQAPLVTTVVESFDPVTIAADKTSPIARAPYDGVVSGVTYTATDPVTGAASPASRTLTLYNRGQAGAGSTVVATLALVAGVNLTANDEKALTLSATPANLVVAAGDILDFESLHIGATGLVDPGGLVTISFARS
jgi:hypothetical protein